MLASSGRVRAQAFAPSGQHVQVGVAVAGGIGATVGVADARTVYVREAHIVSDLEPVFRSSDEQARVAVLIGMSLRLLGFERLIGDVAYRGYDLDVGLRLGPGLSFSTRDSRIDRNRRFVLLVGPVVRLSRATSASRALYIEAGTIRPGVRIGLWQRF